jgi:hypothetical protein
MVNGDRWNAILASAGCLGSARVYRRPKIWDTTARVPPGSKTEKEMPDRASLAIRHLVDVSNQTKTELCVTVVSLSLDFFRCRGLNGMSADFSAALAVDLCQ